MKRSTLFLLCLTLGLTACGGSVAMSDDLQTRLQNPLTAKRYWAETVERMSLLQIHKDKALEDQRTAAVVESAKQDALAKEHEADARIGAGLIGQFLTISEDTEGQALLAEGTLWLGTDFAAYPGLNLHLYLTEAVDPRDAEFPDKTALDLGLLRSPYGAQSYALPEEDKTTPYRTAVLWDVRLGRLYGFAQLSR